MKFWVNKFHDRSHYTKLMREKKFRKLRREFHKESKGKEKIFMSLNSGFSSQNNLLVNPSKLINFLTLVINFRSWSKRKWSLRNDAKKLK